MPTPPPDPPPALSADELRRRLLASTPPPIAADAPAWNPGSNLDLLSRLRMPGGKSGAVSVPAARSVPTPALSPESVRVPPVRRPPTPAARYAPPDPASAIAGALSQIAGLGEGSGRLPLDDTPLAEVQRLRAENRELRSLLDELRHLLQEASEGEQRAAGTEAELRAALAAKDAQVEELSGQLGAVEEQIARGDLAPPPPAAKSRGELEEWADELEREAAQVGQERRRVDDDRRQLMEDEEGLERQMREMEVGMARERAMLARQETELKRLHAEIQHELDLLQRGDAGLREQMAKFQRRAAEVMQKPAGPPRR